MLTSAVEFNDGASSVCAIYNAVDKLIELINGFTVAAPVNLSQAGIGQVFNCVQQLLGQG